jgi:hypothetical protein
MAALAAQTVGTSGVVLTMNSAAVGGDTVPAGSTLVFTNTDTVTVTVTVVTPGTVDGLAIADRTFTVAQNATVAIQPNRNFVDSETTSTSLTYSGVTALKVAVFN